VFENRVLRRVFGLKRDEVTRGRRKPYNEELSDLHSSPNIVRVIKSRRIRWVGHVARLRRGKAYIGYWWGNPRERDHLRDQGVDGRIILRWIFRNYYGGIDWIDLAPDRDRWPTLVSAVMNLRVP